MVSGLHTATAAVAGVDEAGSLVMQLIEHGLRGGLGPPERGELPVSLSGHCEEGVSPVHQVTRDELVWVHRATNGGTADSWRLEENHKEHL